MAIKYLGGKEKYAQDILSVILPGNESRPYFEPFVGSGAFLVSVPSTMVRCANDRNPYLIAMHEAVRDGWTPPTVVTEEEYNKIRRSPNSYPKELYAFVAIGCSFGSKWWGGFARGKTSKGIERNYALEAHNGVIATREQLQGVCFSSSNFIDLTIPDGSLVYCDPPYAGTTDYGPYSINYWGEFKTWCQKLAARDCKVFVSGYKENKPFGWDILWQQNVTTSLSKNRANKATNRTSRVECLFAPNMQQIQEQIAA